MPPLLERRRLHQRIVDTSRRYPVAAVLGARQMGKTALVRMLASSRDHFFDLESPEDQVRLSENAFGVLGDLTGRVVIDEAQRQPELFPLLRVLADRPEMPARFVITGSVSPELLHGLSESLAGRIAFVEIGGFDLEETGTGHWKSLWLRGGHPPSYLAPADFEANEWRENYLDTLVGQDLFEWSGISRSEMSPLQARKLLELLADASGQTWNEQSASATLGVPIKTIRRYVDTLKGAFLVRELPPFLGNTEKRLRKHPTLLFRDTGILHTLLRIVEPRNLEAHPRLGHSWEAFATDQIIRLTETRGQHCFRYSVEEGEEIDLVLDLPHARVGFEFKTAAAPNVTSSMRRLREKLALKHLFVVHPGSRRLPMGERIEAVGMERLTEVCDELRPGRI